jgi:hypothetical protein
VCIYFHISSILYIFVWHDGIKVTDLFLYKPYPYGAQVHVTFYSPVNKKQKKYMKKIAGTRKIIPA